MRTFDTGATRDSEDGKYDWEGFLSPLALDRYGRYMHKHRIQADGKTRASDNWQRGIPVAAYMKSMWRHLFDVWSHHRGWRQVTTESIDDALCGIIFNAMGMLHARVQWDLPEGVGVPVDIGSNLLPPDDPLTDFALEKVEVGMVQEITGPKEGDPPF